jgi:hypothetical protein
MNYYDNYGKVIISKGAFLYHWSDDKALTDLSDNLFLCLDNSFWSDENKTMYKYKLKKNIELILTIQNDFINKNKSIYKNQYKQEDKELLTTIYNHLFNVNQYSKCDDVILKTNKSNFTNFCNKLNENNYNGLFNYIDGDKGQFEIVIFNPTKYLTLIETINYKSVKLHKLKDCKRIMLNKKINYTYPHLYNYEECIKNCKYYPSIFYYIYKKTN